MTEGRSVVTKSVGQLVEEALDAFDDPSSTAAAHVRRAIRIATKRQDYLGLIRLVPWTIDIKGGGLKDHQVMQEARENLIALLGAGEGNRQAKAAAMRHMGNRQHGDSNSDNIYGQSIGQLEGLLNEYNDLNDSYKKPPENLTPIDTYFVARDYDSAAAKLLPVRRDLENLIERVKQSVHDFLVETERQLEQGQRRPDVFDRGREYITRSLRERAPDALDKFNAAEEALDSGSPEDLAHALTSCRRMIKALADALYPPTDKVLLGEDGRERTMSDDAYRNRLLQFASERLGGSTHHGVVKEALRSLGGRLQRLNELSSKGVHDEVSRAEAETCVMWTYLTAADILRIADGTAPRLALQVED